MLEEINQETYDLMGMNVNIDARYINDRIPYWHLGKPFQFVTDSIIEEYIIARNLCPVKMIILGPPASGKTRVAQYLAEYYDISYIHVKSLIKDAIDELVSRVIQENRFPFKFHSDVPLCLGFFHLQDYRNKKNDQRQCFG